MKRTLAAALTVITMSGTLPDLALASPMSAAALNGQAFSADTAPLTAAEPQPGDKVRVALHQEILPPGGILPEHRSEGLRYIMVVSGRLKLSDLVTGEEQVVEAGKIAAEQPGDWFIAQAMGRDPVTLYVIDRGLETQGQAAGGGGN